MTSDHEYWWAVRVELLGGGSEGDLWPRPGRVFGVAPSTTFHDFAEAIDDAFARWDRSHLHEFELSGPERRTVTEHRYADDIDKERELDADSVTLEEWLEPGDEFGYVFDLGDRWRHHCVIDDETFDPIDMFGVADRPRTLWGWGLIPDPYGRLFDGDDGRAPLPPPPENWPWPNAPEPTIKVILHQGGGYSRMEIDDPDRVDDRDEWN